jgi:presenilin-like A22 family membrane protease
LLKALEKGLNEKLEKKIQAEILIIFVIAQVLAVFFGSQFNTQNVVMFSNPNSVGNSLFIIGYVLLSAALILILLYFYKGKNLFRFFEYFLIFATTNLVLNLFIDALTSLLISLLLVAARFKFPQTKNLFTILAASIVGGLIGASLGIIPAVLVAVLLAVYDFIAVFYTKHMVTLAKQLGKREAAFSIKLKEKKKFIELGSGDLVVPSMVSASFFVAGLNPVFPIIGSTVGFMFLLFMMKRKKQYWPALPAIVSFQLLFSIPLFLSLI